MKYLIFIFLFFYLTSKSQINQFGIPFITNYTPQEYGSNDQNWCAVQDNRGVMYIGNNTCILEYDGVTWRKIAASNNSIIRSLAVDSAGLVYVGAVGEFGYLKPDNVGTYQYNSLLSKIDTSNLDFSDIWKTYTYNNQAYFCAYNKIFIYSNDTIKVIKLSKENKFSYLIGGTLYSEHYNRGLEKLENNTLNLIKNGEYFADKDIFFISEYDTCKLLVGTIFNGLSIYNTKTNSFETGLINQKLNKLLNQSYLYNGSAINMNGYGLATLQNGVIFIDKKGNIINHITPREGLQDIIVTNIFSKNKLDDLVWLGLNKGLAKIELNSPIRKFDKEQGLEGSVNDIVRYNGELYVSTDLGVYYLKFESNNYPKFVQIEGISDQSWSFQIFNNKLLIGTTVGLFEIVDHKAEQIIFNNNQNNNYYCYKLYQDTLQKNILFVGHSKGLLMAEFSNNWRIVNKFPEINDEIRNISKTNENILWLGTYFNGIIKISDIFSTKYSITKYGKEAGLESLNDLFVFTVNNKIFFGTASGLFSYNIESDKFIRDSIFGQDYLIGKNNIFRVANGGNNEDFYLSIFNKKHFRIEHLTFDSQLNTQIDSIPFMRLPSEQVDAIYCDENNITWFGSSSGLYSYNNTITKKYSNPYNTLVRKVTLNEDSIVFQGVFYTESANGRLKNSIVQPQQMIFEIEYKYNDITFEFAAPFFEEEKSTEYSYLLEGYKDTWSKWKIETKAVFTNLYEGKYNFKVKAKNIYGIESEIGSYQFSILPPWYRTVFAYIFYVILAIIVIILIVKLYTRKLEQEKIQLEEIVQQRTAEIRCQKEDIERKSEILRVQKEEIELQAIHLGRANKILHEQKEEIFKQKEEITSSIKYAKRIQRAIVPSEEEAQRLLKDYFLLWRPRDIVSGDFWWMGEKDNLVVVAAADCTGHGVPGAFMSMLGVSFLNEIVNQQDNTQSHEILNKLRTKVKSTLGQTGKDGEAKDGMDIALMVIDFDKQMLQYSGAYNPMYLCRNNELIEFKADKNPIGIYIKEKESFTQNIVELQKGDTLYIFSDGYVDQFGGENQMKYMSKRFKEFLLTIQSEPMEKQKELLNTSIDEWRGKIEQIDDIIVLGVRIV